MLFTPLLLITPLLLCASHPWLEDPINIGMRAVQLHYAKGSPPPTDSGALSAMPTPGRPRLVRFDDAKQPSGADATLGRIHKVSVWARSAGSIDAITCRADRGVDRADASVPRYVERSHSSGTRVGRTSKAQHLVLAKGEEVVQVSGHMGVRRLLHLRLHTSRGRSLEWGLEKRAAELAGGRAWSTMLPLGAGWHLVGFCGALRAHEGIIQLTPIFAREDSPLAGGLAEALGPSASLAERGTTDGGGGGMNSRTSSEDDLARFDDTRAPSDAVAAAAAAAALHRAFELIGTLSDPRIDCAVGFPPLAVDQFLQWIGGDGHPKVALFTRALAQLHFDSPRPSVSPATPLAVAEWVSALWGAASHNGEFAPRDAVQAAAAWLLLAASEADSAAVFPSHRPASAPASAAKKSSLSDLRQPDAYNSPRTPPTGRARRQAAHKQWAHWNLYVPEVLPARRRKRDGFGGSGQGAALREGILSQLRAQAMIQRSLGPGSHLGGVTPYDVSHARLPTDRNGNLNEPTVAAVMLEQLLQQLMSIDEMGEGVLPAVDLRRALRQAGLGNGTVDEVMKQPELRRDSRGMVEYRTMVQQLLHSC